MDGGGKKNILTSIRDKKLRIAKIKKKIKGIQAWQKEIKAIYKEKIKAVRYKKVKELEEVVLSELCVDGEYIPLEVKKSLAEVRADHVRSNIIKTGNRIDGRGVEDIRQIDCELDLLPRAHGSALFTRGETQVLAAITLGNAYDEQMSEDILGSRHDRFTLHYNFQWQVYVAHLL